MIQTNFAADTYWIFSRDDVSDACLRLGDMIDLL
jgi:hypothetical protein